MLRGAYTGSRVSTSTACMHRRSAARTYRWRKACSRQQSAAQRSAWGLAVEVWGAGAVSPAFVKATRCLHFH